MRTKPLGSTCNRKRRKNSSSDRTISFCSLLWAEARQRKGDLAIGKRNQAMKMVIPFAFLYGKGLSKPL